MSSGYSILQLFIFYASNYKEKTFSGCSEGMGKGIYSHGAGSGAGHGGRGGSGFFNGRLINGGHKYGNADLPCELGSGAEGPNESYAPAIGGGMIGMYLIFLRMISFREYFLFLFLLCEISKF